MVVVVVVVVVVAAAAVAASATAESKNWDPLILPLQEPQAPTARRGPKGKVVEGEHHDKQGKLP